VPEGAVPPYGVAANGLVAYSDEGDIYVRDVDTDAVTLLVGGPEIDVGPAFSRDGSALAFIRVVSEEPEVVTVMIASPDGSLVYEQIDSEPAGEVHWFEWSPESRPRLVIVNNAAGVPPLSIVKVGGSPERRTIELPLEVGPTDWRPGTDELVFLGRQTDAAPRAKGFYAVGKDGTGLRELVSPPDSGTLHGPFSLSHDGRFLAYTSSNSGGHVSSHILDLDSGGTRTLGGWFNQAWATFSPDGDRLALVRYPGTGTTAQAFIGSATGDGSDAVAIGPEVQNQPNTPGLRIQFSPDATKLLIVHAAGQEAWLADVVTGEYEAVDLGDDEWVSWQRLAP
jgi:Tol biopolymer transport system component